jgi:hypothetical protein
LLCNCNEKQKRVIGYQVVTMHGHMNVKSVILSLTKTHIYQRKHKHVTQEQNYYKLL